MSRTYEFTDLQGRRCIAEKQGIDNLMPIINKRIENLLPKEAVLLDEVKKVIKELKVNYKRDLTPEESAAILVIIKNKMIEEIDKLEKYFVDKNKHNQE